MVPGKRDREGRPRDFPFCSAGRSGVVTAVPARSRRDDFPAAVVDVLARRVGMRCSKPGCSQPAAGPHSNPSKAVNVGVAAHITAAAPGGPRYDPNLTPKQRGGAENGIWLCQNHAKLVDNDPAHFPVDLLRDWKRLAEETARNQVENGPGGGETPGVPLSHGPLPSGPRLAVGIYSQKCNPELGGLTYVLVVQLRNEGDRTARDLAVEVRHTESHCVAWAADHTRWQANSSGDLGSLNPRRLRYRGNLNPDEVEVIFGIPVCARTLFPFEVSVRTWAEDARSSRFQGHLSLEQAESGHLVRLAVDGYP